MLSSHLGEATPAHGRAVLKLCGAATAKISILFYSTGRAAPRLDAVATREAPALLPRVETPLRAAQNRHGVRHGDRHGYQHGGRPGHAGAARDNLPPRVGRAPPDRLPTTYLT